MKTKKIIIFIFSTLIFSVVIFVATVYLLWNGAFNKVEVKNIASYKNNGYTLSFQQLGEPQWSFGATNVRLIVKEENDNIVNTYDTSIQDDGANAGERNIKSIEWYEDKVVVVLQASEMEDKEITIMFKVINR